MEQPKKKKRVELTITDTMALDAIAFVAHPAIEENFLAFSQSKVVYVKLDADKQIVTGPILIPNLDIDRIDPNTGEQYQVFFSEETVAKVAMQYMKAHKQNAVNLEHVDPAHGITLFEAWLMIDPKNDKAAALGYDLPKGTWMGSFKVDDPSFWASQVKTGKVKGFSIEGSFVNTATTQNMNEEIMMRKLSIYKKIKEAIFGTEKFAEDTLEDGTMIIAPDGDFVMGAVVNVVQPDGSQLPLPDGAYSLSDGAMITVAGGSITEVTAAAETGGQNGEMAKADTPVNAPADNAAPVATKDLQKQIDALVAEIEAMKKAMNMKEAELSTATEQITTLSKEKTELEAKVAELSEMPATQTIEKTAMAMAIEGKRNTQDARLEMLRQLRAQK